nr:PREDICTED: uncharacterized protein LOC109635307 [Paralichthys olivaceus]
MAKEPAAEIQLLRSLKVKLIDILRSDPDFVLQHAHSCCLLSDQGYQRVKACRIPSEKVTDLLDHIIQRGPDAARELLELLKEPALQETFPLLSFVKTLPVSTPERKKRQAPETQETIPFKKIHSNSSRLVTERQLMTVARSIGRSWREIGRMALDITSVKLEQIEEDKSQHVERVFAMLCYWCTCQREKATAAHLHSLLSQEDWALPPERIDFLLETV